MKTPYNTQQIKEDIDNKVFYRWDSLKILQYVVEKYEIEGNEDSIKEWISQSEIKMLEIRLKKGKK